MSQKNKKLGIRIFSILAVTASIIYAGNNFSSPKKLDYTQMSTPALQIEVERLANEHKLTLEIQMELMKRWTAVKSRV